MYYIYDPLNARESRRIINELENDKIRQNPKKKHYNNSKNKKQKTKINNTSVREENLGKKLDDAVQVICDINSIIENILDGIAF